MTQSNPFELELDEGHLDGCIGPVTKDPWDDDAQTDWPNNSDEASE